MINQKPLQIYFTEHFKKQLKKLKKKYPQCKNDVLEVINQLALEGQIEHASPNLISIGKAVVKIRIPSSDMQKGKSAGFRSYIYLLRKKNLLIPLCMYAKADTSSISSNELKYHLDQTIIEISIDIYKSNS